MTRHDLLEMEQRLRACMFRILPFEAHALYFPQGPQSSAPVWIPEESRLLLPLMWDETTPAEESPADGKTQLGVPPLGVFMARGVNAERVEALLPDLPALAGICLDNLELYRTGRLDATTGLAIREVFLERIREAVARIVEPFSGDEGVPPEGKAPEGREGSFGVAVLRFPSLENLTRQWGHSFAERFLTKLAATFRAALPESALAARVGDHTFAVLFPGADRAACVEIIAATLHELEGVTLALPHSGRSTSVLGCAGFALYPQDMDGDRADLHNPAPALLHKAGLAADVAQSRPTGSGPRLMAYGRILAEGGAIRRILPLSRVALSLGHGDGAREGQCFSVWSTDYPVEQSGQADTAPQQPLYKGELVILEAREGESTAEILHLGDPSWPMRPGDTLALLPHNATATLAESAEQPMDALTGLCRHGDFLARMVRAREGVTRFALVMVHLSAATQEAASDAGRIAHVARQCREAHAEAGLGEVLGGRFATNTLIYFHPMHDQEALTALYTTLASRLTDEHGQCAVGLAPWPFLQYHPGDAVECCRKALEYAQLLPLPHVGLFNSLALNISADKKHCRGDVFGAIEEYKLALLVDSDNALAWNSLGVCMTGLGRHDEARHHFEEALRRTPDDAALAYNTGVACQHTNDPEVARDHFLRCLELAPAHLFAVLRLGQLSERRGDLESARAQYLLAAKDSTSALPHRHLARIALRENNPQAAREAVHEALLRDPRDAESLSLMARLYLDGGEDADLALRLARQSLALRPESKNGWLTLARALEARALHKEAKAALLKAGEL